MKLILETKEEVEDVKQSTITAEQLVEIIDEKQLDPVLEVIVLSEMVNSKT